MPTRAVYKNQRTKAGYRVRKRRARGVRALWKKVNYIQRMNQTEFKYLDASASAFTVTTTATLVLLNGMAAGDTATTRDGQAMKMVSSYMNFSVLANGTAVANIMRVILVYDSQPNGAAFAISDLLSGSTNVLSPFVIGYARRLTVLRDERVMATVNGSTYELLKHWYKKFELPVRYFAGTGNGTITDIATGSLYLVLISDEATNGPSFSYYHRLRFIDA